MSHCILTSLSHCISFGCKKNLLNHKILYHNSNIYIIQQSRPNVNSLLHKRAVILVSSGRHAGKESPILKPNFQVQSYSQQQPSQPTVLEDFDVDKCLCLTPKCDRYAWLGRWRININSEITWKRTLWNEQSSAQGAE